MEHFKTPLLVEYLDGRDWKLVQDFTFECKLKGIEINVSVPKDFITDFASIPRFFWRILPPTGLYGKAAVIHDYLYKFHMFDRKTADKIFLKAMKILDVPFWKRRVMYRAVRIASEQYYNK